MKHIFHKNQMIIATLAIMIAVAGYINYTGQYITPSTKKVSNTVQSKDQAKDEISDVGEAVLTNAQVSNYVAKAKLEREQTHSKAKDTLQDIIDNKSLKDSVKQEAVDKMAMLCTQMEQETATENLLGAKGFLNSIVTISNDNVDVLVNMKEISKVQKSQIEDIVTRKTGYKLEDVVITSMKTQDS